MKTANFSSETCRGSGCFDFSVQVSVAVGAIAFTFAMCFIPPVADQGRQMSVPLSATELAHGLAVVSYYGLQPLCNTTLHHNLILLLQHK